MIQPTKKAIACSLLVAGLTACGGGGDGGKTDTGSDSDDNSGPTAPVSNGPVGGNSNVGSPATSFNESFDCAIGSPEGTRQPSTFEYQKAGSIMRIKVGGQPVRQVSQKGSWQREFHQSSITHAINVNANNYFRVWMTVHDNGRLIGGGMNGNTEAATIYCGEALRDPVPETPSSPQPAPSPAPSPSPDLSAPSSFNTSMNCAVGRADGALAQSSFRYDKPTQFMTITRNGVSWQASAMGTWSRQTHTGSSTYAVDANGSRVRRFWMGVATNGQLIGGGMNGIDEADSIYCGVSAG